MSKDATEKKLQGEKDPYVPEKPLSSSASVDGVKKKTALLLIDIQNDFLPPSGSLAVPEGRAILEPVYELLEEVEWDLIAASMDSHPQGHVSFASSHSQNQPFEKIQIPLMNASGLESGTTDQVLWPDHCIPGSKGWELEEGIKGRLKAAIAPVHIVRKGTELKIDSYSAFADNQYTLFTSLSKILYQAAITRVVIVGLALDYCVYYTAVDAIKFGFEVLVMKSGCKPVDSGASDRVVKDLMARGVTCF